jgi:hypothetical protein
MIFFLFPLPISILGINEQTQIKEEKKKLPIVHQDEEKNNR